MRSYLASIYRYLPSFSARFHIVFGLCSLLSSVVLLSMFLGFVPDRKGAVTDGRIALSEALASSSSMLLKRGDLTGIRSSLEFIIERDDSLQSVVLFRLWDNSEIVMGAQLTDTQNGQENTVLESDDSISVPLYRGSREWGELRFVFSNAKPSSWLERVQEWPFGLMLFISLLSFPLYYFYLGKMLKELNPSQAVPGRVRSALDTIAESLLVIDRRGNLVLANSAFAELTGQSSEQLLGVKASTLTWVRDGETNPVYPWESALKNGEVTRQDMIGFHDASGVERKFIVNCSPVGGSKGKVGGVLISMEDVTLLEEKEVQLRQSMQAAEDANQAKSAFLSNMSHEIRTPMTAILGFTEVLKRGAARSDSDRQKYLNTISSSGQHLLELINDVLDLSKVESGAMEVEQIDTPIVQIAHEVFFVLQVKAKEKGVNLQFDLLSHMPENIIGDPSRLRQIITNLVGNAIKFTEKGTVSLQIAFDQASGRVNIAVKDTGIGMSEAQQSSIFEAFTQADVSITRRFGGTGLGLSISRKLAHAMNGDILVDSVPGEGSTFTLTIPAGDTSRFTILSPAQLRLSLEHQAVESSTRWEFPASEVLVVDDAAENRELLSLVLSDLGINVSLAENGQEAIDAVAGANFDLILMDIQMPVMDGYEAVSQLRKRGVSLPVVALTANAMKGFEDRILEAGFSDYQSKPIDLDKLTELLAKWLGGHKSESASSQGSVNIAAEPNGENELIFSALVAGNPRFAPIVEEFLAKLDSQLDVMRLAMASERWQELKDLGHWLKGSGGTIGFDCLREPAANLELAAFQKDPVLLQAAFHEILTLRARMRGSDLGQDVPQVTEGVSRVSDPSLTADTPVTSTLITMNTKFKSIVERFIPKLSEQMSVLQLAFNAGDFEEVARVAHWLKGSGGNLGFEGFIPMAELLEQAANAADHSQTQLHMESVQQYANRVRSGWFGNEALQKSA